VAHALGRAFAEAGVVVVSGMARGIDSAAHLGALEAGGKTIAVLGTGVDVPYPAGNRQLHERICRVGLVVSENAPGRTASPGCFPRRNRIIAALARATIVVEAGHKSGALNTASQALQLGRVVGAVPGMIDMPRSMGSNQLMRDGGQVIGSVDDALALMSVSRKGTVAKPEMTEKEAVVWHALTAVWGTADVLRGGKSAGDRTDPDAIAAFTGLPVREVFSALSNLELVGLVRREPDGQITRADLNAGDLT
jgi:DNA processing protein